MNFNELSEQYPDLVDCWSSIGDGWTTQIVAPLFEAIKDYPIKFNTIKEKFGGLRLYYEFEDDDGLDVEEWRKFDTLIHKTEMDSYNVCESCGTRLNVTTDGQYWIKTLCMECRGE